MIRYRQIGYVEFNVTDLARSSEFYRQVLGLPPLAQTSEAATFRFGDPPESMVLHQLPATGSGCLGLVLADDAQFESLHRRLWNAGHAYRELSDSQCSARHLARATRMVEPFSGLTLEFYLPADLDAAHGFVPSDSAIRHIGQLVLATPRADECLAFYRDVLSFVPQPGAAGPVRYLQPYPNPLHQRIGIMLADEPAIRQLVLAAAPPDGVQRVVSRCLAGELALQTGSSLPPAADTDWVSFADPDGITVAVRPAAEPVMMGGSPAAVPQGLRARSAPDWRLAAKPQPT